MKTKVHSLALGAAMMTACALLAGGCATGSSSDACCTPSSSPAPSTATTAAAAVVGPVKLSFVKADSEETGGENGRGANAVDGDPSTLWHTQWQDANPPCPHEIVIELTPPATIKGFTYLPRQDDSENGTIKEYEFYVSSGGDDFGQPVAKGSFEGGKELKTVNFTPHECRFIKLKAISEINGEVWSSAAEIGVVQ